MDVYKELKRNDVRAPRLQPSLAMLVPRMLLLLVVAIATTTCGRAPTDRRSPLDRLSSLRQSGLDVASWIKLGMETEDSKTEEESDKKEVCVDSSIMRWLLRQVVVAEDRSTESRSGDLLMLTDDELKALCALLCGAGICPPGCPENNNPCPWGCPK